MRKAWKSIGKSEEIKSLKFIQNVLQHDKNVTCPEKKMTRINPNTHTLMCANVYNSKIIFPCPSAAFWSRWVNVVAKDLQHFNLLFFILVYCFDNKSCCANDCSIHNSKQIFFHFSWSIMTLAPPEKGSSREQSLPLNQMEAGEAVADPQSGSKPYNPHQNRQLVHPTS